VQTTETHRDCPNPLLLARQRASVRVAYVEVKVEPVSGLILAVREPRVQIPPEHNFATTQLGHRT
jgi:hypothetical protein